LNGYHLLPRIHKSESIVKARWKRGQNFKIGNYIYNFNGSVLLALAKKIAKG
jgi:hypothetical protein